MTTSLPWYHQATVKKLCGKYFDVCIYETKRTSSLYAADIDPMLLYIFTHSTWRRPNIIILLVIARIVSVSLYIHMSLLNIRLN